MHHNVNSAKSEIAARLVKWQNHLVSLLVHLDAVQRPAESSYAAMYSKRPYGKKGATASSVMISARVTSGFTERYYGKNRY